MKDKKITLDSRLAAAAGFVRDGSVVADIGTDHAYLPIYLLTEGRAAFAIASDVNRGPLERARANAEEYGVADKMQITLSDGLDKIEPEKYGVTDIVICGMGGELIARIIADSEYTKRDGVRLVLQPMTCAPELRLFLAENGYNIVTEKLCMAAGKIYTCILAEYDGVVRELGECELILGKCNIENRDPLFSLYADGIAEKLQTRINGLRVGGHNTAEDERILKKIKETIKERGHDCL